MPAGACATDHAQGLAHILCHLDSVSEVAADKLHGAARHEPAGDAQKLLIQLMAADTAQPVAVRVHEVMQLEASLGDICLQNFQHMSPRLLILVFSFFI